MKVIDPKDHPFYRAERIIVRSTPKNLQVFRHGDIGWEIREKKFFGSTIARIRSTFNINLPTREIPEWIKQLAEGLEKIKGLEIQVHLEQNDFLP